MGRDHKRARRAAFVRGVGRDILRPGMSQDIEYRLPGPLPEPEAPAEPADPTKKRRGPPKGSPKVPGSGRKPTTLNNVCPAETAARILGQSQAFSDVFQHMVEIASGRPIALIGPTGKRTRGPAPVNMRVAAGQVVLAKIVGDQRNSTIAIDAKAQVELTTKPEPSSRELARVILNIFYHAGLESEASLPLLALVPPTLDLDDR